MIKLHWALMFIDHHYFKRGMSVRVSGCVCEWVCEWGCTSVHHIKWQEQCVQRIWWDYLLLSCLIQYRRLNRLNVFMQARVRDCVINFFWIATRTTTNFATPDPWPSTLHAYHVTRRRHGFLVHIFFASFHCSHTIWLFLAFLILSFNKPNIFCPKTHVD